MRLEFEPKARVLIVANDSPDSTNEVDNEAAEVFRQVRLHRPKALLIWIERRDIEKRTALIAEARRRCPHVPLIALGVEHDEQLERAVRVAGVAYYFSLVSESDHQLLAQALETLGIEPTAIPANTGLSPPVQQPRTRASPAPEPQARGRPTRLFRH